MMKIGVQPRFDFETIKTAVNRWRTDHAPGLTRDETIRHMLGEWLMREGCLPTEPVESPIGNWVVVVTGQRDPPRGRCPPGPKQPAGDRRPAAHCRTVRL